MEQASLFDTSLIEPLAYRMRPRNLNEFVGQEHLIGENKILRKIIESDHIPSMIFWGPPGVGKTTLIKEILNENSNIKINPSSKISYFRQDLNNLDENKNIIENILRDTSQDETTIRNILASLNIKGDDIYKKVEVLSGGERVKVSLTKIMTSNSNFLILDEPTNFLDIESIEALEYLMKEFKGTVLFVTHDRNLIDNVATNIMIIENKKIIEFEGNYTKYLKYKENKKKCISNNDLLLDIKLAEITSKLSICKDEREKQKLEEEYMKLIKNE